MKLLMILCPSSRLDDVQKLIDEHDVHGYTELPEVRGAGLSGKHMGTRAWPGVSAMVFTVVEDPKAEDLLGAVRGLSSRCAPDEGLRAFVLPVDRMV